MEDNKNENNIAQENPEDTKLTLEPEKDTEEPKTAQASPEPVTSVPKEKKIKKGMNGFVVFLIILLVNAVWVAAAMFYFIPLYNDAIEVREQQIETYEKQLSTLQSVHDNSIIEYDKKIDELKQQLDEQGTQYKKALELIEKYAPKQTEEQRPTADKTDSTESESDKQ